MKQANIILLAAVCSIIFSFMYRASGADDTSASERIPWWREVPETELATWNTLINRVKEKDRDAFPELAQFMAKSDLSIKWLDATLRRLDEVDGWDILTQGDPHLLASIRGILPGMLDHDKRYEHNAVRRGLIYLAKKGDARDFPLFEKYMADPMLQPSPSVKDQDKEGKHFLWLSMPYRILQHRVAGTNIVKGTFPWQQYPYFDNFFPHDSLSYSTNALRFIPSAVNSGPQAAYVYEAMEQAINKVWAQNTVKRTEGTTVERSDSSGGSPYGMLMGNAPELLTMRVWFDANGEAVCDVDLAKHGIFVPGLRTADANADTSGAAVASPPPRRKPAIPLAFAAGVLAALGALATLRKKHRQ